MMFSENDSEIIEETKKSLQKIAELFGQAFKELLKEKQAQAAILIKLNKTVAEFKQLQEMLKKHGIDIDARLESFKAELIITNQNKKIRLPLTKEDDKFLKSLKIVPPDAKN